MDGVLATHLMKYKKIHLLLSESFVVARPHYSVDASVLSGGEACQLQQGHGSGNQGDYWRVHLPKERGAVSDCPVRSQRCPQGALLSLTPRLTLLHFIALAVTVRLSALGQSSPALKGRI